MTIQSFFFSSSFSSSLFLSFFLVKAGNVLLSQSFLPLTSSRFHFLIFSATEQESKKTFWKRENQFSSISPFWYFQTSSFTHFDTFRPVRLQLFWCTFSHLIPFHFTSLMNLVWRGRMKWRVLRTVLRTELKNIIKRHKIPEERKRKWIRMRSNPTVCLAHFSYSLPFFFLSFSFYFLSLSLTNLLAIFMHLKLQLSVK